MSASSALVVVEVLWLALALVLLLFGRWRSVSEACAVGALLAILFFSIVFQLCFLLTLPELAFAFEGAAALGAGVVIAGRRAELRSMFRRTSRFLRAHAICSSLLLLCGVYLLLLALLIPPSGDDSLSYNLTRVFLFQQDRSLLLRDIPNLRQAAFPVGSDILAHAFLRFRSDYGIAFFSFLAYGSIVFGSYGLARRVASEGEAFLAALVVAGMPGLVFQATNTKNDIFLGASAVCCFLVSARLVRRVRVVELLVLLAALGLGVSAKTTFWAFAACFLPGLVWLLAKAPGWGDVGTALGRRPLVAVLALAALLLCSQVWLYAHNLVAYGDLTGNRAYQMLQDDGLLGGVANLVRHTLQSVHLFPFDWIAFTHGLDLGEWQRAAYAAWLDPVLGPAGFGEGPYRAQGWDTFWVWVAPHEDWAWYGPFGALLVLPATLLALWRGSAWLRLCAFAGVGYGVALGCVLIWLPWDTRYFLLAFAASGGCLGFLLHTWRPGRAARGMLASAAIGLLLASCALNFLKPLVDLGASTDAGASLWTRSIWVKSDWGRDRRYFTRWRGLLEALDRSVEDDASVALVAPRGIGSGWQTYSLYLEHPGEVRPITWQRFQQQAGAFDYLVCLYCQPSVLERSALPATLLWRNEEGTPLALLAKLSEHGPRR